MELSVDIRKKLGDFQLDIRFRTEAGVFALLGASGCGKSMTLKCIAGIEQPDEGTITLGGRVLFDSARKISLAPQKRRVGYMFQDYALFPNMTVRQNVAVGVAGRAAGTGRAERTVLTKADSGQAVEDLLTRFHIADLAEHYPAHLSGGQKQRVAMARLIGQEPDVILLDEPFSALDSHLKWQLEQEMKTTLAGVGVPAIFVSHDRDEVYHLASTVCCMDRGHSETIQPMKQFFAAPETRSAAVLSGCKNVSAAERGAGEGEIFAKDWGIILQVPGEIPEDLRYIGIRAHDFVPVSREDAEAENGEVIGGKEPPANRIEPVDVRIQEDPFEWTVFFRAAEGKESLQWKTPKKRGEELRVPGRFRVDGERILLLR